MSALATAPSARRSGVGRTLMSRVEAIVWEAGESVLSLQVDELNGPALQLYRGLGYEVAAAEARQHRWERTLFMRPAVNRWSAGSARPPRRRGALARES